MKRNEFFKEMKSGLFRTLKTVYEPFVEEDLKKIEKTTNRFLGINWHFVCSGTNKLNKMNQFFINGKPILIIEEAGNMKAISGICPECSNLLTFSVLFSSCKCLNCEKSYNFQTGSGELVFLELPLTNNTDGYYVGLKK